MAVDSRRKGQVAELKARDALRDLTGYKWERIPNSGALKAEHGLKGDLYIPQENNYFCVEVKHYKEDQLTSKILSGVKPIFIDWWNQTKRQAKEVNKEPLLIFKYDRSKWFVAYKELLVIDNTITIDAHDCYTNISLLTNFCKEWKQWLNQSTS